MQKGGPTMDDIFPEVVTDCDFDDFERYFED